MPSTFRNLPGPEEDGASPSTSSARPLHGERRSRARHRACHDVRIGAEYVEFIIPFCCIDLKMLNLRVIDGDPHPVNASLVTTIWSENSVL